MLHHHSSFKISCSRIPTDTCMYFWNRVPRDPNGCCFGISMIGGMGNKKIDACVIAAGHHQVVVILINCNQTSERGTIMLTTSTKEAYVLL